MKVYAFVSYGRFGWFRQKILISLSLILFLAVPFFSQANGTRSPTFTGKVVAVSDGETISVMRQGRAVKVRLHGIDCPEKKQAYGTRAKQFTSDMAFGKEVEVRVRDTDRYGRLVGEVILSDGTNLNQELVGAGFAWWYRK